MSTGDGGSYQSPHPINSPQPRLKIAAPVSGEPMINQLFRTAMLYKGSDLHLRAGSPAMSALRGVIQEMNTPVLTREHLEKLIFPILKEEDRKKLEENRGLDFVHVVGNDEARYRVNLMNQGGRFTLVARPESSDVPGRDR